MQCNKEFLLLNWGEPDIRKTLDTNRELWTYENGWQWVGLGLWIVIPIPPPVPAGTEKIDFEIRNDDGAALSITLDTTRDDLQILAGLGGVGIAGHIQNEFDIVIGNNDIGKMKGACFFQKHTPRP